MSEGEDRRERPVAPAEDERDETFLRRWSRRKQEARHEPAPAPAEPTPAESAAPAKVLTDADMPPLESLDWNSDFSPFMSPGVSEGLRRQALRKLFVSPEINRRCPLDSEWFDGDGALPLGDTITHEMREQMERAAEKLKESAQDALREDGERARAPAEARPGAYGDLPSPNRASAALPAPEPTPPAAEQAPPADPIPRKEKP